MTFCIHVSVLLLILQLQSFRCDDKYCPKAVESAKIVTFCPTSKEEWDIAASKKNCSKIAALQNCTEANKFLYHCVINGYKNETLEVCAPPKLILGHCTEFNVAGDVIQGHRTAPCNKTFPKCDAYYNSTHAYKYPDCYQLVYKKRVKETLPSNSRNEAVFPAAIGLTFLVLCGAALAIVILLFLQRKRHKKKTARRLETEERLLSQEVRQKEGTSPISSMSMNNGAPTLTDINATIDIDNNERKNKAISENYIIGYKILNEYFVETARYLHAKETFFRKGIVIFSGPPGCGKTMAAVHLIIEFLENNKNWTFRRISKWEELSCIDNDESSLVFIDNLFLSGTMDSNFQNWWKRLNHIHQKYLSQKINEFGSNRLRIIMTAGTNVIERACDFMTESIPVFNKKLLINISSLEEKEKIDIFSKQVEFAKKELKTNFQDVDDEFIRTITQSEGPIGFPLCANLYACNEKYRKEGSIFFSRPIEYLKLQIKTEIEGDKKNQNKSLFFFLFFYEREVKMGNIENLDFNNPTQCRQFLDKKIEDLDNRFGPFAFKDMKKGAQSLRLCSFFKDIGERQYRFVHDSVYEAVGTYFCGQSVEKSANYLPLDIIKNQSFEILTDKQKSALFTRLLQETHGQRLSEVFTCKIFRNQKFAEFFCSELHKVIMEHGESFFTLENKGSANKLPALFWSSCNNLTFLTEGFYDIITKINIDTDKQLFVSLYGLCCAKNEGSWKINAGSFDEQFEQIKEHVLAFRDGKGNSILHLIITSDFTDQFVATAVEKVTENNQPFVDCKNQNKVTPIMAAVEQPIRREKVIKALLKLSAKLRYADKNNSTVFHHCLGSCNDDETCAEYLKLLLNCKDQDTCNFLCIEDVNGNTVLNIAAKESKRSRIQSILILLESNAKIVDTLNGNGYSPLHLCVTSLSGGTTRFELECCVRVITLILYNVDPEKKSDENEKAIDKCEYESVKKILKEHENQRIMKEQLDILLKKMNSKELHGEFDKECINSVKLSSDMCERLAKAVKCLKKKKDQI